MSSLPVGTDVQLTGLSSKEYNGKKGRVAVIGSLLAYFLAINLNSVFGCGSLAPRF